MKTFQPNSSIRPQNDSFRSPVAKVRLTIACAIALGSAQAGDTKPFKETGTETVLGQADPGTLQHPLLDQIREAMGGNEIAAYVIEQYSKNNVGGKGLSLVYELIYPVPGGIIAYAVKFEKVANGDEFVLVGVIDTFNPDGTAAGSWMLVPELGTGRFAGAAGEGVVTGGFGAYKLAGWMTTVGAAKK